MPIGGEETSGGDQRLANPNGRLLRACPELWYENHMPQVVMPGEEATTPSTYLVIDGTNYQESQVDLAWIRANCEITQPEKVY